MSIGRSPKCCGGSRRPPRDDEFIEALVQRPMPRRGPLVQHILEGLENAGKEKVAMPLTIEHVLPQTRNLPPDWQKMLGADWKDVHERCVQRLGNLTLTAYNSELGARPLREKQEIPGGYRESKAVWLNSDLRDAETWNEASIEARGRRMSERALQLWPRLNSVEVELDRLELDPGAGGPILTASDRWKAWRRRGALILDGRTERRPAAAGRGGRVTADGPAGTGRRIEVSRLRASGRCAPAHRHRPRNRRIHLPRPEPSQPPRMAGGVLRDEIEREDGTPPIIGSADEPGDIDVWLPPWSDPGTAYPLTERRQAGSRSQREPLTESAPE